MFSMHGKILLINSYRYYTMLYGYGKYQFIILHILIFFGKGKLKDCRKDVFRIFSAFIRIPMAGTRPRFVQHLLFPTYPVTNLSKISQIITPLCWKYRTNVLR